MNQNETAPTIFLAGPPGVGKSTLGRAACERLGLRFAELAPGAAADELAQAIAAMSADVVELPWELQLDPATYKACRQAGRLVGLWAHPLDMQRRSGRPAPLFTPPSGRAATRGGFGRKGTSCSEYRRLARACDHVVMLVGAELEAARDAVAEALKAFAVPPDGSLAEQEGIADWGRTWQVEYRADREAADAVVDAIARYLRHLREAGKSPRVLSDITADLDALSMLNFMYDSPKGRRVLDQLTLHEYEYSRKFSDSPFQTDRYERNCLAFIEFVDSH